MAFPLFESNTRTYIKRSLSPTQTSSISLLFACLFLPIVKYPFYKLIDTLNLRGSHTTNLVLHFINRPNSNVIHLSSFHSDGYLGGLFFIIIKLNISKSYIFSFKLNLCLNIQEFFSQSEFQNLVILTKAAFALIYTSFVFFFYKAS